MKRWASALMVAAAVLLAAPASSRADLDEVRQLMTQLKYRKAYKALNELIEAGGATPAQLAELHRLGGELQSGLGDADKAANHFAHYLALDPEGSLEPGASPKLTGPFEAAQETLAGSRLVARHTTTPNALEITVDDPTKLARAILADVDGEAILVDGQSPYRVVLPPTRPLKLVIAVLDEHGNQLVTIGSPSQPLVVETVARSRPGVLRRPSTWAITAGVSVVAAVAFGLGARSAQSELDDLNQQARDNPFSVSFDEIRDVEKRGKRYALATNISIGVAGAATAATIALWFRSRNMPHNNDANGERALEPTVSIMEGELTVGARARF